MRSRSPAPDADRRAGPAPTVRGVLLGLVCGAGGVVGHALTAASHVDAAGSVLTVLLGLALGPVLARRPSATVLVGGALSVQVLGHLLMSWRMAGGGPDGHAGHLTVAPDGGGVLGGGALMLLAHLTVTVLTAALALGADRAVVSLLREWLCSVLVPRPTAAPAPAGPPRRGAYTLLVLVGRLVDASVPARAPPRSTTLLVLPA